MRVPAHIRFTLAELTALHTLPAGVYSKVAYGCHLVLTEDQQNLPSPELHAACSIISVEDADGITVAVLKHRTGETWDRRVQKPVMVKLDAEALDYVRGLSRARGVEIRGFNPDFAIVDEREPVVPRREPPHSAPAGEDRFQRGVDAMSIYLKRQFDIGGPIQKIEYVYGLHSKGADLVRIDGEFSLRYLAKAFLDAYQPQITISDQVRFKQAVAAMKQSLHRQFKDGGMERITWGECGPGGDDPKKWPDIIGVEGDIDINALAKAFWSVMKGGEGE